MYAPSPSHLVMDSGGPLEVVIKSGNCFKILVSTTSGFYYMRPYIPLEVYRQDWLTIQDVTQPQGLTPLALAKC